MRNWNNKSLDLLNGGSFRIVEPGPLHAPVEEFSISRDEKLALTLETRTAPHVRSAAEEKPSGATMLNTATVELVDSAGVRAVLSGVQTRLVSSQHGGSQRIQKETARIHQLSVTPGAPEAAAYTIEWLENLPSYPFVWPDNITLGTEATDSGSVSLGEDNITISHPQYARGLHGASAKLLVAGHTLHVCALGDLAGDGGTKPGCIVYVGTPDDLTRKKIRNALSLALGPYLIEMGHSLYDKDWRLVFAAARSAYSLGQRAFDLLVMPFAPLTDRNWQYDLGRPKLTRMLNALVSNYEVLDLGNLSWAYWHARIATVHIAPAHFGAAIEALLDAYAEAHPKTISTTVLPRSHWKPLKDEIERLISEAAIPDGSRAVLNGGLHNLNRAPLREILKATCRATGMELGVDEKAAWKRRNDAAHGTPIPEGEELFAIRDMKLLSGLFQRLLLRISDASDAYIDYATPGFPVTLLKDPPPNVSLPAG